MPGKPGKRPLDDVRWAVLLQEYEAGATAGDIAEKIGQGLEWVTKKLRRLSQMPERDKQVLLAEAMRREYVRAETALYDTADIDPQRHARTIMTLAPARKATEARIREVQEAGERFTTEAGEHVETISDQAETEALRERLRQRLLHTAIARGEIAPPEPDGPGGVGGS